MSGSLEAKSKFLSLILRHRPESVGLALDTDGWVDIETLIEKCGQRKIEYTPEIISDIIAMSDAVRFELSPDRRHIRATHGHSVAANIDHLQAQPPNELFHGTAGRFLDAIRADGLTPQGRQHVHLSSSKELASRVGQRHISGVEEVMILRIDAAAMVAAGKAFYLAGSGVWLTKAVASSFIRFPETV